MKVFFCLLASGFSLNATAAILCSPKEGQDPAKNAGSFEFNCGKGKQSFVAACDITTDPVETGNRWLYVKSARWKQHGKNQGIEGKFGFIVCSKK
jgi:hypothetical protein